MLALYLNDKNNSESMLFNKFVSPVFCYISHLSQKKRVKSIKKTNFRKSIAALIKTILIKDSILKKNIQVKKTFKIYRVSKFFYVLQISSRFFSFSSRCLKAGVFLVFYSSKLTFS